MLFAAIKLNNRKGPRLSARKARKLVVRMIEFRMHRPFQRLYECGGLLRTCRHLASLALLQVLLITPCSGQSASVDYRPMVGTNRLHTVRAGEDLLSIARRYQLAVDHLAFANGYSPLAVEIDPGTELVIPLQRILPKDPPANGIVLNLPERGLYFFRGGQFQRFVAVSIGDETESPTPTGNYHIIERIANPTWYPPAWSDRKGPVPPGEDNPLGKHWIGLSLTRTGIHGTNDPLNIGNAVTHGCIRAYPEVVEQLFREVQVGWPVRIEYETVKFGKDQTGRIKMATFFDIYGKQAPKVAAERRLGQSLTGSLAQLVSLDLGTTMEISRRGALFEEIRREAQGLAP